MTAEYPDAVYSPRTKENKSGVVYDAGKPTVGYAEDVSKLDEEVVSIQTILGDKSKWNFDTIWEWLDSLATTVIPHDSKHENGGTDEISVAGLSGELADNQPPKSHQSSHEHDGSDPLTGAGIEVEKAIAFFIDGGGSAITTGIKGAISIPFKCEILGYTMITDQSGSTELEIWKDTYANYPPTAGDSITGGNNPSITTALKTADTTLTDWTKTIAAGDILMFNIESATTIEWVMFVLKVKLVE